jgi:multiple sugar transport system ATP-binding protein
MAAVVLDGVCKVYDGNVRAVDNLRLEIPEGELLVLLGPSGCGKTTILRLIAGLEELTSGNLYLAGELANDLPANERNIAMVFQQGALYPHLSVRENLLFPLKIAGDMDKPTMADRVQEIALGLGIEDTLDRRPGTLSGGQRQRVAIGRALIRGAPTVMLMDEPLASLDAAMRVELRSEIGSLVRSLGLTTVYVTHDQVEALALADRIVLLRDGQVQDAGTPSRIYTEPATAFAAAFLGSPPINMVAATVWAQIGEQIIIDFGPQQLFLPWADARAESLTPFHGDTIMVGIRPDVLRPVTGDSNSQMLRGRVHSLEYQGHEWLARIEAGLRLMDLGAVGAQHAGHEHGHRRSSLLVRLSSPRGWSVGQDVTVAVDVMHIYLFDTAGRRVDTSRRGAR